MEIWKAGLIVYSALVIVKIMIECRGFALYINTMTEEELSSASGGLTKRQAIISGGALFTVCTPFLAIYWLFDEGLGFFKAPTKAQIIQYKARKNRN